MVVAWLAVALGLLLSFVLSLLQLLLLMLGYVTNCPWPRQKFLSIRILHLLTGVQKIGEPTRRN